MDLWEQRVLAEAEQEFVTDRYLASLVRMLDPRRRSVRRLPLRLRGLKFTWRQRRGRALFAATVLCSLAAVGTLIASLVSRSVAVETAAAVTISMAGVLIVAGCVRHHGEHHPGI
ncbi:MAG TPA: hypothetical protein VH352_24875 [Pseudonocardiaceae bacterium]|nr:hypothetical protein [Pseudonocardiaceae bacterium]